MFKREQGGVAVVGVNSDDLHNSFNSAINTVYFISTLSARLEGIRSRSAKELKPL